MASTSAVGSAGFGGKRPGQWDPFQRNGQGVRGNPCKLDEGQVAQLRAALEAGPAAYGWAQDQRWTPARAAALVMRLFGVSYTLRGVSFLLHRLGFSPQVPAHRAFERNEDAIAEWRTATWAKVRGSRR
ncbi:MAG: putative family transposase [Actinomycetia bacterium]|nr:putative family transposase [Actinomycetes bacterium]